MNTILERINDASATREMREIYAETIEKMILQGKPVLALDADLMRAINTFGLWDKYPNNIIECGVAEANMIGVAAGLSSEGYIPFTHSFAAFASRRVMDQVFMSGAYAGMNIKIIGSDPGIAAALNGGTHTANEDIAIMRAIPGMTIMEPSDAVMASKLIPLAAEQYGMFYIRYTRTRLPQIYSPASEFEIGKAALLRDGRDVTIIASGIEVFEALEAADMLGSEGIDARVLDMFTIKPLDRDAILSAARETGAIVTAENHNLYGGLGSAVAEVLVENHPVPMERVANMDVFGDVGKLQYLKERYGLTADVIVEKAKTVLRRKG